MSERLFDVKITIKTTGFEWLPGRAEEVLEHVIRTRLSSQHYEILDLEAIEDLELSDLEPNL